MRFVEADLSFECHGQGDQENNYLVSTSKCTEKKQVLKEDQDSKSSKELASIVANVTWTNPVSDNLFMGKYIVFLLDNLVPWQKPIGEHFKSTYVICAVKLKKLSEQDTNESVCDTSAVSPVGNPLMVQFEKLICPSPDRKHSTSVLQQLSMLYDIYPLSVSSGKKLLFLSSKFENQYKLPFVTICHGNRIGSLILFGAGGKSNAFHLKLFNQGNVSALKNLPSIQDLKTFHMEGLQQSMASESCTETRVSAVYEFLGLKSDDKSNLIPVKGAHLSVQCTWSVVQAILEPLPTECICIAKLQTVAGDDESGAFTKYKEMKLLKALQQSLTTGLMTWTGSSSLDFILEEITELLNEERKKVYNREYPELPDGEVNLETVIANERLFLSLPDRLWLILTNCSSFEDLIAAIQHTYKTFAELNATSPLAYGNDMSTISKDITLMFEKAICCPELNQKRSAELLLEIGVEKMRRDYYEFFISHGFVTQDLFNHFTQPALLSSEAVTCLEKLHSILELTLVCIKQLNLNRSILNEFVRNALKRFTSVSEVDLQHVFTFHIPTFDIRSKLNTMRPVVWEISLKSGDKNFMKQSCHRFVTTATHDHIYAPQNYNPKLMLKGASYAYSTAVLTK